MRPKFGRAQAKVEQMTAAIATAEGRSWRGRAPQWRRRRPRSGARRHTAATAKKQRDRIRDLASRNAIERKVEEEYEDQFQAASSAENFGE